VPPKPPNILGWPFHSPARLAAVTVVVAGIVVGGVMLARSYLLPLSRQATPPAPQPVAQTVAQPRTPTASATSGDHAPPPSERVPSSVRTGLLRSARAFVDAWALDADTPARMSWLREIRPLTTQSLYEGLRATDLARLPRGHVRRADLRQPGPFAGTVVVVLTRGVRVEVGLVAEQDRWLVADIRPAGP
jgi:hypothetical protein